MIGPGSIAPIALLAVLVAGCHAAEPQRPAFAVGSETRDLVDPTRETPANGTAPAAAERDLTTEIWYPAEGPASPGDETRGAPLARGAAPFPLVLFVHGSSGTRLQSTFLTQGLAAAGYVVVAADMPLTAMDTPGGASDWHVEDQREDLSFLADQLAAAAADPTDTLAGAVDPAAGYAVVGHSTGGTVAQLAAYTPTHDARVRAVVSLSGDACFFADTFFASRSVPLLVVTASRDLFVPPPDNGDRTYELATAPKVKAALLGGMHLYFTDYELDDSWLSPVPTRADDPLALGLAAYGDGSGCSVVPPPADDAPLPFADQHALTTAAVRAFLDAELGGDARALDDLGGLDPRLVVTHEP